MRAIFLSVGKSCEYVATGGMPFIPTTGSAPGWKWNDNQKSLLFS